MGRAGVDASSEGARAARRGQVFSPAVGAGAAGRRECPLSTHGCAQSRDKNLMSLGWTTADPWSLSLDGEGSLSWTAAALECPVPRRAPVPPPTTHVRRVPQAPGTSPSLSRQTRPTGPHAGQKLPGPGGTDSSRPRVRDVQRKLRSLCGAVIAGGLFGAAGNDDQGRMGGVRLAPGRRRGSR